MAHAEWLERRQKALDATAQALRALVRADIPDREPDHSFDTTLACPRPGLSLRGRHERGIIIKLFLALEDVLGLTLEYLGDDYGEKDEPVVLPPATKTWASLAEFYASLRPDGPPPERGTTRTVYGREGAVCPACSDRNWNGEPCELCGFGTRTREANPDA
jgi:hypothetical protein